MSWFDYLNPFKKAWHRRDEWVRVDVWTVSYTKEKHDCPSWDIGFCNLERYKHKEHCEERIKTGASLHIFDKTVFEDPTENDVKCCRSDVPHVSQFDVYKGGKYE